MKTWEIMERQVERIIHLIDDLPDVSRITRGKAQLKKERVDALQYWIQRLECLCSING